MKTFSISDIEVLTGIKAHTIRIWEQRYTFLTSKRSETNIRYYDSEDLRLFLNIATLNQNGYKISKISKLTLAEINKIVNDLKEAHFNSVAQVQMLSNSILRLDGSEFEEVLSGCVLEMGLKQTMDEVIIPLLNKLKFMWQAGIINVAQIRFATHLTCNQIINVTSQLPEVKPEDGKRYLLFLANGEFHEIRLLFNKYILKEMGQQVLYLGTDIPIADLIEAITVYDPHFSVSVLTEIGSIPDINAIVNRMFECVPDVPIILTGKHILDNLTKSNPRLIVLQKTDEFIGLINSNVISLAS